MSKFVIRNKFLQKNIEYDEVVYQKISNDICNNVLCIINSLDTNENNDLGLYWPMKHEPDLMKIIILTQMHVSLPKIQNNDMYFVRYHIGDYVDQSLIYKDLYQPSSDLAINPSCIIVPGVCFGLNGYRIGFGKGYYDKYFNSRKSNDAITTIGVCFQSNLLEHVPNELYDYRLDYIVTEYSIIKI